jgi:hypothetical protein
MSAAVDICLPNFHGKFILFQEIADQDASARRYLRNGITEPTKGIGDASIAAFKEMCAKTSFPEFADYFEANMRRVRMFFSNNHVSHHFTIPLFQMLNEKFLHLPVDQAFYDALYLTPDMYASHGVVPLTRHDVEAHGWQWNEPILELKL